MCYAVPVCRLWPFGRVVLKLTMRWETRAAGSIPHHTPLLWKFTLTRVCPRLQFIEAINPSVFILRVLTLFLLKALRLTRSALSHSHVKLSSGLNVSMDHVHPTKHPSTMLNDASTPVGSLPMLRTSELISYLSTLLQYQIMYYAPARHLPSPENHLFLTVMSLTGGSSF